MPTAIIGTGNIGRAIAEHLVSGGENVVLAAQQQASASAVAEQLGDRASSASVTEAIKRAHSVIFAVWFDVTKQLIAEHATLLDGKVIIDPSNPVAVDGNGQFSRTLPDGVSAGSVIYDLVPPGSHFVKAFGTLSAASLASAANRVPERAVLFYTAADDPGSEAAERLIRAAGFDPLNAGDISASLRIEMYGDLHEYGGLDGKVLELSEARAALART